MNLKWTDDLPTANGYYWTMNPKYMEPAIEEIEVKDGKARYYVHRDDQHYEFKGKTLFAGPIEPPSFNITGD